MTSPPGPPTAPPTPDSRHPQRSYGNGMTAPEPTRTITDVAHRLGLTSRSALRLVDPLARHLNVHLVTAARGQLVMTQRDFDRLIELADVLRVSRLTLKQLEHLQRCTDDRLWTLLRQPAPTPTPVQPPGELPEMLAEFRALAARMDAVTERQLDLLHHVAALLPTPTPVPAPAPAPARRDP